MHLTRFTDYSLRVLIYLGQHNENRVTIQQISDAYGISKNHLMKVVSNLTRLQFVAAQRGPGGGIQLNRLPKDIVLNDVVSHTEKSMQALDAEYPPAGVQVTADVLLGSFLRHALQAYLEELSHYTLADVLKAKSNVSQLLEISGQAA
jgi:Rrf2 family transcriptional regulator, nitric oxide-sensitive transcriptional repressor